MIEVQDLTMDYHAATGRVRAVAGVSFTLAPSEILGLVGESGSGKSSVATTLLGHVPPAARIASGRVLLHGQDLLALPAGALASYRGRRLGYVPQNPAMGLSPHLKIGRQFAELVLQHGVADDRAAAMELARSDFALVGLPEPRRLLQRYPHELSGGQQQRVCIAMAVACRPELLVLDEPTTGLDVTTQMRIIELLKDLRSRLSIGMLYVTHDLGLLAQIADRVGVMYAGRLVELAPAQRIFSAPRHPYTRALIASVPSLHARGLRARRLRGFLQRDALPEGCSFFPRCDHAHQSCAVTEQAFEQVATGHSVACQRWKSVEAEASARPEGDITGQSSRAPRAAIGPVLVELKGISLAYGRPSLWRRFRGQADDPVVEGLDLQIGEGEVFALVGESGSGKSTIARALGGLVKLSSGEMRFRDTGLPRRLSLRPLEVRRQIQYVFQNPDASLNPRERVDGALKRPLRLYFNPGSLEMNRRVRRALEEVRLDPSYARRFPDQLSGGERQRTAIARGILAEPSLILCDEVLSALDVSVQASILDLLARLREETGVAMLFISHDLAVVRTLADRTGVLFRGSLVAVGRTGDIFEPPYHPYTEELLLALPSHRARLRRPLLPSTVYSGNEGRGGCVYASRCRHYRGAICDQQVPPWRTTISGNAIRCHVPLPELLDESLIAGTGGLRTQGDAHSPRHEL